jgi:integrase
VALSSLLSEIIERQKNTDQQNPFLFPILEPGLNAVTIKHRCQRFVKWVNKHMNEIRQELSIESSLNTYAARHSFSTMLKRKGVSTSYIKEALGHSSEATTEHYLDSFSDEVKTEYAYLLTDF